MPEIFCPNNPDDDHREKAKLLGIQLLVEQSAPNKVTPTAPRPVQIAYAVPVGSPRSAKASAPMFTKLRTIGRELASQPPFIAAHFKLNAQTISTMTAMPKKIQAIS